jgi:hypothetical protein
MGNETLASESRVQSLVRLEAAAKGVYLWRNNVGAGSIAPDHCPTCGHDTDRRPIRWGLANDSAKLNKVLKSADLIGGRPVVITPDMVGKTVLVFTSRECKPEGWEPDNSERYLAQKAWADLINKLGGDAAIVTGVGSL